MTTDSPFTKAAVVASSSISSPSMRSTVNSPRTRKNPPVALTWTSSAAIDVDILSLQTPIEPDGPAGVEVLRLDGTLHLHGAARREVFDLDPPFDLEGPARFDGFRLQVPRNAHGASGTEFLDLDVPFEGAGTRDAGDFRDEGPLDPRAPRRLELVRPDGVAAHHAASDDFDRFVAQLRRPTREVDRPHRLSHGADRVVGHASGVGGRLRDRASNRGPEIDARGCGLFRFLRLVRFGLVAGFDLQVRLFVDLAARESLLELTQDVLAFHSVHRIGLRTAKYVSLWSNTSNPFRGIGSIAVGVIVIPFRPRRCRPRRIVAS